MGSDEALTMNFISYLVLGELKIYYEHLLSVVTVSTIYNSTMTPLLIYFDFFYVDGPLSLIYKNLGVAERLLIRTQLSLQRNNHQEPEYR